MISLIPKPNPTTADIMLLKSFANASVAEIRRAAESGTSIRDFRIFEGDWHSERCVLARLYRELETNDSVPFVIHEDGEGFKSNVALRDRLRELRRIELEQQLHTDLEMGFIQTREQFQPHDDEWFLSAFP